MQKKRGWKRELEKTLRLIPGFDPWAQAGGAGMGPGGTPHRLEAGATEGSGACWLDHQAAQDAIDFFAECLRHIEGAVAGQPFVLEPWEAAIVGNLFGWKRRDEKGRIVRRFREVFLFVPRKNGKTPLSAGICLLVLFCDGEPGAQIVSAAGSKGQAGLLFRHAKMMVRKEPELASRADIYDGKSGLGGFRSIVLKDDPASVYSVVCSEDKGQHGTNLHMALIDELHVQDDRGLVDTLLTGTASENRAQPIVICLTTSDYDRPSICNEKYDQACRVRDNGGDPAAPGYDPAFLPVIYEAKPEEDWKSERTWFKANPNLGVSVSLDYLRRECKKAQEIPGYENTFKRLHLNMRTRSDVRWLDLDRWDRCRDGSGRYAAKGIGDDPEICRDGTGRYAAKGTTEGSESRREGGAVLRPEDWLREIEPKLAGRKCYTGLDLSTKIDLTAVVHVFPPLERDGRWIVLPRFFAPAVRAERREKRDKVPYLLWAKLGFLTLTDGDVVDYDFVKSRILEDGKKFEYGAVAFDPWSAAQIALQLAAEGLPMVEFGQGYKSMSEPSKELEKLVIAEKIDHGGNPILRWNAGNCSIEQDAAGNIKPSKKKSTERIDGIIGLIMGLGRAMLTPVTGESVYETRGLISL